MAPKKKPAAKKKAPPRLTKGAQNIANTLAGGGMTMGPPLMGMPANGPMQMGIMGPEMKMPPMSGKSPGKKASKRKPKKK